MKSVREPAVAGMFYPEKKGDIKDQIKFLLEATKIDKVYDDIFGLIAPHAGYTYSGKTTAYAYNLIKDIDIENVILVSPSHREYFKGSCIFEGDAYKTPLGEIEINTDIRDTLVFKSETIFAGYKGHDQEHAIEVHLPFLQTVLKKFKLVPIIVGDQSLKYLDELVYKLAGINSEKTLVIASSDLSHFYTKKHADEMDSLIEENINSFDYNNLYQILSERTAEACGGGPIYILLKTAAIKGYLNSEVLYRNDSSEASGVTSEVVGYLSAVVYGK